MNEIAKIVFDREPLADFVDRVWKLGYGGQEDTKSLLKSDGNLRPTHSKMKHIYLDVFHQITVALANGLIEAQVVLELSSYKALGSDELSNEGISDSSSDYINDFGSGLEDFFPIKHLVLSPSFWQRSWQADISDWQNSTILIDLEFVNASSENAFSAVLHPTRPLLKVRPKYKQFEKGPKSGQVFIKQSELAISHISDVTPIFRGIDADRYTGLNNRFIDELVAVTWRKIAVKYIGSNKKKVVSKKLLSIMKEYMTTSGVTEDGTGVANATITAISEKLAKQFTMKDTTTRPFVNSTPIKSRTPRPETTRRRQSTSKTTPS